MTADGAACSPSCASIAPICDVLPDSTAAARSEAELCKLHGVSEHKNRFEPIGSELRVVVLLRGLNYQEQKVKPLVSASPDVTAYNR
eukprot:6206028-Pleurochrysis_carterae.AAC.2